MTPDPLSATFAALADPTRRAILARLSLGESTVTELAEPFQMSLPAVTKHLKVLEKAGLIRRGRAAQWRPCALQAQPLKEAVGWLEQYRQFWEQRLDRLEAYLQQLQQMPETGDSPAAAGTATTAADTSATTDRTASVERARKPRNPATKRPPKNGAH